MAPPWLTLRPWGSRLAAGLLLRRLNKGLERCVAALEEGNRVAALALKLELVRAGVTQEQLEAAEPEPAAPQARQPPPLELLQQTQAQREEFDRAYTAAVEYFGDSLPANLDVVKWARAEGLLEDPAGAGEEDAQGRLRVRVFTAPAGDR